MRLLNTLVVSAAALILAAGVAEATPIMGTFHVTIYQGTNTGGNSTDPDEQATTGNPLINPANEIAAGTYMGSLDWEEQGSGNAPLASFVGFKNGLPDGTFTLTSGTLAGFGLSTAPFALTTVFVITANVAGVLGGTVSHDDGMTLYDGGTGFANIVAGSPSPTSDIDTPFSGLTGNVGLVYVEANGLPADIDLNVTSVPEPLTISVFGVLLAGAAAGFRRRQKKAMDA